MIVINECRITPNGECLIVEASVSNMDYYDRVYIDSIVIDNQETFVSTGPSSNPVYQKTFGEEYNPVSVVGAYRDFNTKQKCCNDTIAVHAGKTRHIRLQISAKEIKANLNNDILFVYIVASGVPKPCTPCGMDNTNTMAIAYNKKPLYQKAISYVKEMGDNCTKPKGFIDYILRLKAFELSYKAGQYPLAIEEWKKLSRTNVVGTKRGCGCNGYN